MQIMLVDLCWINKTRKKGVYMCSILVEIVEVERRGMGKVKFKLFDTVRETAKENKCALKLASEVLVKNGYSCQYKLKNGRFQQVFIKENK